MTTDITPVELRRYSATELYVLTHQLTQHVAAQPEGSVERSEAVTALQLVRRELACRASSPRPAPS